MDLIRKIALGFAVILFLVGLTNYIPGLTDAQGRAFGIFALDIFDDALHFASAAWAGAAALLSRRASEIFLKVFGALYLADGAMGLALGSGFLDFGIVTYGIVNAPPLFKFLANLPHLTLGAIGVYAGFVLAKRVPAR
jgi:hypothetical protein